MDTGQHFRTRVKICGITNLNDALSAIRLGADAIGLVFYQSSPRYIEPATAARLVAALPPFVSRVGLFVNCANQDIQSIIKQVELDILQFHGDENPQQCNIYGKPYIKAIRVRRDTNLKAISVAYHDASALLLDSHVEGLLGGTGKVFDWDRVPNLQRPIILAGGLTAENVAMAIEQVHPYAVDVSSGVEKSKGIKDSKKISAFIREVYYERAI